MPPGPDPGRRLAALGGELGAGRLLGPEGFIAAGPREHTAAAMEAAGAAFSWLDRREIAARIHSSLRRGSTESSIRSAAACASAAH